MGLVGGAEKIENIGTLCLILLAEKMEYVYFIQKRSRLSGDSEMKSETVDKLDSMFAHLEKTSLDSFGIEEQLINYFKK